MASEVYKIGDFYRGDSLRVKGKLTVRGQPDALALATIELVFVPVGTTTRAKTITHVVPADAAADAGEYVLEAGEQDTLLTPGRYDVYLIRIRGNDRWTFHEEQLVVRKGAPP